MKECRCTPCQATLALGEMRILGSRVLSRLDPRRSSNEESGVFVSVNYMRKLAKPGCENPPIGDESAAFS